MKLISRQSYLDFLIRWKDQPIIKVVSGIRRCGKSTLFELYRQYLLDNNVNINQINFINFEDIDNEPLTNYKALYDYINSRLLPDVKNYIFLDEIQHVLGFEKAVDSLHIKQNVDLYITGSNAYFMSGELATLLSGRYVELEMLPLSFKEYINGLQANDSIYMNYSNAKLYSKYTNESSFPYTLNLSGRPKEINEYLSGIYNSILVKDVISRYKISDVKMLESVTKFIFDNIGNILSSRKIANTMTSLGRKIDAKTVEKYIKSLCDSLITYKVSRYNIKGKELLASLEKYYVADLAFRNILLGNSTTDFGHLLENTVYLELIRRGYTVYIGTLPDGEVDFVAQKDGEVSYYQVSATVLDSNTLARELAPLQKISDHSPKYLLTLDELASNNNYDGIKQLNLLDWLLR